MKLSSARIQTVVLFVVVIGVIALALSGYFAPLSNMLLTPFFGAQTWVSERYLALQSFWNAPQDLARLRQRNVELEAENSRLKIQILELQQQVVEAQVLATLVDYARSQTESRYTAAEVIGYDTSPFLRYVLINRGSDDGLRSGMPVVTNQGLVGQISAVTAGAARVQLISDSSSSVNVRLQQTDEEAVLQGQLNGDLVLNFVPQSAKMQAGDLIVTSGLGGNYPANILVGQVTNVQALPFDLFQTAAVQPAVDFSRLEIVLVITNFQPVDIGPLIPDGSTP